MIRINNLYEYAFNRLEVGALSDDILRWYEECFEFLVEQKEELSALLNKQNHQFLNNFLKIYWYLCFLEEEMEAVIEKISLASDKIDIIELYSVGEKIHDVLNNCNQNLRDLKSLIDSINANEVHPNQMIIFEEISKKKKKKKKKKKIQIHFYFMIK